MKIIPKIIMILLLAFSLVGCGKAKLSEEEISNLVLESGIEVGDFMLAYNMPIDEIISFDIIERATDKKNGYDEMNVKIKAYSGEVTVDAKVRVNLEYDIETWKLSKAIASEKNVSISIDRDLSEYIKNMYSENETIKEINIIEQEKNINEKGTARAKVELVGQLNQLDGTYRHILNVLATPESSVSVYGGLKVDYDIDEVSPIEVKIDNNLSEITNSIIDDYKKTKKISLPNQIFSWYEISDDMSSGNSFKINKIGDITFTASEGSGDKEYDSVSVEAKIPIDFTIIANSDPSITKGFNGYLNYTYNSSKNSWKYSRLSDE